MDNFDNKGRKVCCKVSLYKNCQRQSCRVFNCLSSGIRWGPSSARNGHSRPIFSARVYCGHGRPSQLLLSSCFSSCALCHRSYHVGHTNRVNRRWNYGTARSIITLEVHNFGCKFITLSVRLFCRTFALRCDAAPCDSLGFVMATADTCKKRYLPSTITKRSENKYSIADICLLFKATIIWFLFTEFTGLITVLQKNLLSNS